jgi:hypothetical protein
MIFSMADSIIDFGRWCAYLPRYIQNDMSTSRSRRINREGRQLRSDVLLVKLADDEWWMQFRDVFEVDRRPVRDQRLYKLFVDAKIDAARASADIHRASMEKAPTISSASSAYRRWKSRTHTTFDRRTLFIPQRRHRVRLRCA